MENLWFFGQYSDYGQYLSISLNWRVGLFMISTYKSTKIGVFGPGGDWFLSGKILQNFGSYHYYTVYPL